MIEVIDLVDDDEGDGDDSAGMRIDLDSILPGQAIELHEDACPSDDAGGGCECSSWLVMRRPQRT